MLNCFPLNISKVLRPNINFIEIKLFEIFHGGPFDHLISTKWKAPQKPMDNFGGSRRMQCFMSHIVVGHFGCKTYNASWNNQSFSKWENSTKSSLTSLFCSSTLGSFDQATSASKREALPGLKCIKHFLNPFLKRPALVLLAAKRTSLWGKFSLYCTLAAKKTSVEEVHTLFPITPHWRSLYRVLIIFDDKIFNKDVKVIFNEATLKRDR